jgi:hypothetical protein
LPVQFATKFELVINLKTAGPRPQVPAAQFLADDVIE